MRRQPMNWYTTNELADRIKVAWETSDKHLQSLHNKGFWLREKRKIGFIGDYTKWQLMAYKQGFYSPFNFLNIAD